MGDDLRARSAEEVFEDHLRLAGEHRFDEDIEHNISGGGSRCWYTVEPA